MVLPASDFGEPSAVNDFINVSIQSRVAEILQVGGGIDTGRSVEDYCFVVNSPQDLSFRRVPLLGAAVEMQPCRVVKGMADQMQVRFYASVQLPAEVALSAIYNNLPGYEVRANYTITRAEVVGLGRLLSTSTAVVPLLLDEAQAYDERRSSVDLQLSRPFDLGNGWRVRPQINFYNLFNSNAVATRINTFGPRYGASTIIPGRTIEFSGELTF